MRRRSKTRRRRDWSIDDFDAMEIRRSSLDEIRQRRGLLLSLSWEFASFSSDSSLYLAQIFHKVVQRRV